ncbi:hypothetical protein chiPu_0033143, partial [Chiloscyllium punctatum]|nr:hypothetical protein [Chiloscyllium punctatum]
NLRAELPLLALELELLAARSAQEIRHRTVVRELRHLCSAAVRTIGPSLDPGLRPGTSALGAAGVRGLRFFEAEFHEASVAKPNQISSATRLRQFDLSNPLRHRAKIAEPHPAGPHADIADVRPCLALRAVGPRREIHLFAGGEFRAGWKVGDALKLRGLLGVPADHKCYAGIGADVLVFAR